MTPEDTDILSTVRAHFYASPPARLGVAVSGGSDSLALLHVLVTCFAGSDVKIDAVTVDHGLRAEAAREIDHVRAICADLGISHSTLSWDDWDRCGNLQAEARKARYRLMGDWARARGIAVLAIGHTADDQAETVLMRLARSPGVNGLAGMPARRTAYGVSICRPLLGLSRQALRDYLVRRDISWIDDPSNADDRFDRVRARSILGALAPLGVTVEHLASIAANMTDAREALDWYTFLSARDFVRATDGDVVIDLRRFRTLPDEIARRLLVRAVMWIGQNDYPPRRAAVAESVDALRRSAGSTLGGCQVLLTGPSIWICREYRAVRATRATLGTPWDQRWHLKGLTDQENIEVRALGRHGLAQVPDWRDAGRPHASLMAAPSVWSGDTLIAAPHAGFGNGWQARLEDGDEAFFAALLSH